MLLQRLAEYAAAHPDGSPPYHREREFSWQLELTAHGELASPTLTPLVSQEAGRRPRGVRHITPSAVRTAGVAANLAADDAQYVLGWEDPDSKPDRIRQCHAAFVELTRRWADSDAGRADPIAQAVATFYRGDALTRVTRPEGVAAKQGVIIAVAGVPAYRAPSVAPFWITEVAARKGGTADGVCLVCGRRGPLLDSVPGKIPARLVPGASNDTALVSINERVFGYDLSMQLAHTPLCLTCGQGTTAGLTAVLASDHAMTYGEQDSRIAWWVTQPGEFDAMDMLNHPDPAQVTGWLTALRAGNAATAGRTDTGKFCSLTVGGNVARVMVRDWIEMPLGELNNNIAKWFADTEIANRWGGPRRHHGLFQLLSCTGRWRHTEPTQGGYMKIGAKGADRPVTAHRDLLRAAIRGTRIPPPLLTHVIRRVRADGRLDDPRAALIRLGLIRSPHLTEMTPMPDLDPTNTDPAYVAGRAFAELEHIQDDATGAERRNSTYGDRYFSGAVVNPRVALINGRRDATAWLKKLRRTHTGAAIRHEQTLDELFGLISAEQGLPARTTLRQQGAFLLGYHHQRAYRYAGKTPQPTTDTTPTAERQEIAS